MQADSEGMVSERLAIDDSRPSPEISSSDHKFSRSFRFKGLLETTRTPWPLMFSVTPSWAGWRTSKLQRSTLTDKGMRGSTGARWLASTLR